MEESLASGSEPNDNNQNIENDKNGEIIENRQYISILPNVNGICLKSEPPIIPSLSMVTLLGGIDIETYLNSNKAAKPLLDKTPGAGAPRPQMPIVTMGRTPGASNNKRRINSTTSSSLSFAAERIVVSNIVSKSNERWLSNLFTSDESSNPALSPKYDNPNSLQATQNSTSIDNYPTPIRYQNNLEYSDAARQQQHIMQNDLTSPKMPQNTRTRSPINGPINNNTNINQYNNPNVSNNSSNVPAKRALNMNTNSNNNGPKINNNTKISTGHQYR